MLRTQEQETRLYLELLSYSSAISLVVWRYIDFARLAVVFRDEAMGRRQDDLVDINLVSRVGTGRKP